MSLRTSLLTGLLLATSLSLASAQTTTDPATVAEAFAKKVGLAYVKDSCYPEPVVAGTFYPCHAINWMSDQVVLLCTAKGCFVLTPGFTVPVGK